MKKILIILLTIILFGCMDKTDERGFYIEGKKIGYHKETKTLYDKNGYDKDGYNEAGYNKEGYDKDGFDEKGWSKSGINKETKTQYDKDGFDEKGWNKENINKETKTLYDIEGFDINGWSKDGINKNTGYTFNENGLTKFLIKPMFFDEDVFKKPYNVDILSNRNYFIELYDEFKGTYYLSRSYETNLFYLLTEMLEFEGAFKLSSYSLEATKIAKEALEAFQKKLDNIFLDINIFVDKNKNIIPYLDITFCTVDKIYDIKEIEILANNKIINLPIESKETTNTLKMNSLISSVDLTPSTKIYFNQIKIDLTDELFDILAKLKIDEEISIRVLADNKDIRFNWTNKLASSDNILHITGLPAGLGYYYNLKNNK